MQNPEIEQWRTKPYDMHAIQNTILQLKTTKQLEQMGSREKHIMRYISTSAPFAQQIMNNIMRGEKIPDQWTEGAIN